MEKQMEKRVVGEASQKTKSKWFSRLIVLAMGLVLSVGGILGAVMLVSDNKPAEYADAAAFREARNLRVGDYIQNFGGRKWRVIGHDTNGSITGQAGAPLLRTDSAEPGERRFHSSNNNHWVGSELRTHLNGAFFTNNFSAAERGMVIHNVRLETIRTQNRSYAGSINGSGWASAPNFSRNAGINGLNGANHNTRHRYYHRDTVFILCSWQNYNLNRLGLRYGNTASTADGGSWQSGSQNHVSDHFAWPRRRDGSGNANRQAASVWVRSPVVCFPFTVCLLVPRWGGVFNADANVSSGFDWCCCAFRISTGPRSFAPALYIAPSTIFQFARNSDTGRNEQANFRVYQTASPLATPGNVRLSGDTLQWNAVTNADGYRVYRGTTLVQAVGNVTSLNLLGNANIPVGTQHTFSVSATVSSWAGGTSARGGSVTWGQLSTPTGVAVNGTTLSWGAVTHATGYQIRLGTTVIATVGAVTSHNLGSIAVNLLGVATHTNLNVVAISSAASWGNSAASANVSFTRAVGLHAPHDAAINVNLLTWNMNAVTLPFVDSFHIRVGSTILATVGRDVRSFDLSTIPEGRTAGRNTAVAGSLGALQAGSHAINVVAVNNNATAWPSSAQSNTSEFYRAGRVDSITLSGNPNLIVGWPRPDGINGMPSSQLVASVVGLYGSNMAVTWHSSNPDIVSVDAGSGFIRASWPSGLSMWELAARNHNTFTVITARSVLDNSVIAQMQVLVVFETPPVPIVVGVEVSGGVREIELAPCGTRLSESLGGGSLSNATQFVATAFGYNLAGAGNTFSWASSDSSVATIDSEGRLTVRGVGIARITARSSVGNVPYAFYVTIAHDGTSLATAVTILCDNNRFDERRIVIPYDYGADLPFVELRAHIEGHNITSQLVTWTSSCGATLGNPSLFLEFSLSACSVTGEGLLRIMGLSSGGPFIITATPVGAIGAVGTFRIFVDRAVAPAVTSISVSAPSVSEFVIPNARPILSTDMPSTQLTATTIGGVGGGTNSAVVWTVYPLGFVELVVSGVDPNVVVVRALDRGTQGFVQAVTITATSSITPSQFASRQITVMQGAIMGIKVSVALGGAISGEMFLPYATSSVEERQTLDLRAIVATNSATVSQAIRWETSNQNLVMLDNLRTETAQNGLNSLVTLRPLAAGTLTIWAVGIYCGSVSNKFEIEILQSGPTSVRIFGPNEIAVSYEMHIALPRPDAVNLPIVQLGASVGGSFAAARNLEWTSSCGGLVVEFLGSQTGGIVLVRAVNLGVATITATHTVTGFYANFTVGVDQAALESIEILGDGVVREQTAMLIPLVYTDGVYTLSDVTARQSLELSLLVNTHGNVTTDFVWTSSDENVIRLSGHLTDRSGFVQALPYGVGTAIITATSTIDPTFYAEFTIFVTRGTASCSIQDGILDLPTIKDGYVRIILVCEHYFGTARMSHQDLSLQYALEFILPHLQLNIYGAVFFGWSLSRNGNILQTCEETEQLLLPLLDIENGADTILLFAVWYIPYIPSESNGSNLARNIIIGTLSVAGVGAAGTAGYIAQSKIRKRREADTSEWGMD